MDLWKFHDPKSLHKILIRVKFPKRLMTSDEEEEEE